MRIQTISRDLYRFDELSESAQDTALDNCRYFQVDHDWWDFTHEDAARIGLTITGFDLDRNRHAEGYLTESVGEVCRRIIAEHGPDCDTTALARDYYSGRREDDTDPDEFLRDLLEIYSVMLQNDSEYLTSDESVREMIAANDYEFTADGEFA